MPSRPDTRIPVYLLTGYLGSGKTSLLKSWLTQPELADAALVINELGEVGLDHQLLSAASESTALVANACVCCTGLPGLAEALEDLFWARLERRIPRFPSLVIETTGLAEPAPVRAILHSSELLRERYRLAGVITCLSASTADAVLSHHAPARAQLAGADLLILTKTDLLDEAALSLLSQRLAYQLDAQGAQVPMLTSAKASLTAAAMLAGLPATGTWPAGQPAPSQPTLHAHEHEHGHHHDHTHSQAHAATAHWWPLPEVVNGPALRAQIEVLQTGLGAALLRLKGRVLTNQGAWLVQLAPFDAAPSVVPDPLPAGAPTSDAPFGLTVIVAQTLSPAQAAQLAAILAADLAAGIKAT